MILVTGAAGFIGSTLVDTLLNEGQNVIGIDNFDDFYDRQLKEKNIEKACKHPNYLFLEKDITDVSTWKFMSEYPITVVIHLAAKAGVLPSLKDPAGYIHTNIIGTQHVLDYMVTNNVKKILFASSSSIYGNNPKTPFSETDFVDHPISPYAFTKKSCELMLHTYHHLYKIDVLCMRFFTVYGPRQRPDLAIRKFVDRITHHQPIEMYGDGTTARDYTFIEDTIQGIVKALDYINKHQQVFEVLNFGNSSPISLYEMIHTIYKQLNTQPNIVQNPCSREMSI
jgi:Nucleoside-diphosphate-sugar epimerases